MISRTMPEKSNQIQILFLGLLLAPLQFCIFKHSELQYEIQSSSVLGEVQVKCEVVLEQLTFFPSYVFPSGLFSHFVLDILRLDFLCLFHNLLAWFPDCRLLQAAKDCLLSCLVSQHQGEGQSSFFLSPACVPSKITTQNTSVLGMPEVESEPSTLNFLPALRFGLAISMPTLCVLPLPQKQCYRRFQQAPLTLCSRRKIV